MSDQPSSKMIRYMLTDRLARLTGTAMFFGLLGTAVRVGSNILLLPVALAHLSPAEMSAWWIFLSLGAISNLADFGFAPAITRVYSFLWAGADDFDVEGLRPPREHDKPNLPRISQLHGTVAHLYGLLAALVALALAGGGTFFLWRTGYLIESHYGWIAWAVFIAVTTLNLKTSYWSMAAQGINRVREVQMSNLLGGLVYLFVGAFLLMCGLKLLALAAAVGTRAIVSRWVCMHAFRQAAYSDDLQPTGYDRSMLTRLWPNAKKLGIMSIGSYCITQGLILVGSQFLPVETVASLGLTQQIGIFATSIASLWLQVKWPQITILRTQGRLQEMSALFAQRLFLAIASFALIAAVIIAAGNMFLEWKGTQTRLLPFLPLTYYLGYLAFQMTYGTFGVLTMTENVIPFHRIAIFTGIAAVTLSVLMTSRWHLWGLLLAPLICEAAYSAWFTIRRGFAGQPLTVGQFVRAAVPARP